VRPLLLSVRRRHSLHFVPHHFRPLCRKKRARRLRFSGHRSDSDPPPVFGISLLPVSVCRTHQRGIAAGTPMRSSSAAAVCVPAFCLRSFLYQRLFLCQKAHRNSFLLTASGAVRTRGSLGSVLLCLHGAA